MCFVKAFCNFINCLNFCLIGKMKTCYHPILSILLAIDCMGLSSYNCKYCQFTPCWTELWNYLCILFKLWKKWKYNGSWKCKVQLHLFQVFNIQRNVENILDISLSYTLEVQCNSRKMITQAFTTDNISEIGGLSIGVLLGWDKTNFLLEHLKQSLCSFWKNLTGRETWMWSHHPFAEDHLLYGLRAKVFPELFCQHNIWHCQCSRLWIVI